VARDESTRFHRQELWILERATPLRVGAEGPKTRRARASAPGEEFTSPKWSRDGRWLAGFTHPCKPPPGSGIERRFCGDLWLVRTDGSERRRIVSAGVLSLGAGSLYEWAPDGRALAYSGSPTSALTGPPRYEGIVLVSTSGDKVVKFAFRNGAEPTWAPGGRRLAFSRGAGSTSSAETGAASVG
jgi:WD40-like Beta Propeller Repeat